MVGSPRRLHKGTLLAGVLLIAACDQVDPGRVCISPETVRTVRQLVADDVATAARAFNATPIDPYGDRLVLENVTLEGFDRTLNRVECAASLRGLNVRISYTRQPDQADPGRYLYSIGDLSPDEGLRLLSALSR